MKRKLTAWFILFSMWILLPTTVQAQETSLTTIVPSYHTIHLLLKGEGKILIDGVVYTETSDLQTQRHHRPEISILVPDGSNVKTVLWNNEDVTASFQNGKWIMPEISNNAVLTIVFESIGSMPQTGDASCPELWSAMLILSIFSVTACLLQSKKKSV